MIEANKKWKYATFGLMAILATGLVAPQAFADLTSSVLGIVQNIQSQVNNPTYGLQAIKNAVGTGASQTSVNNLQGNITQIKTTQYVPFVATLSKTVVCVASGSNVDSSHSLTISGGGGSMIVSSVIISPNDTLSNTDFIAASFVSEQGNSEFLPGNNMAPTGNTPTNAAFDIMGKGDHFPNQVAGEFVSFNFLCSHDSSDHNLALHKFIVSGWKEAGTTPTVSYQ